MTVSIIVPVYEREWFQQCLDSIKAQTYKDIELIIEDDPTATGAAAARNRGLDKATGEFIAFCDADDYMEPDAVEKMVDAIQGVDMVAGSFRKFGDFEMVVTHETKTMGKHAIREYVMGNLLNPRTNQMLSGCWAKLYKRRFVRKFPALVTAEDMAFNFTYLDRYPDMRFLSDMVYHNRKHDGSLSTTFDPANRKALFDVNIALRYVQRFLGGHNGNVRSDILDAIDTSKVYHSMLYAERIGEDALRKVFP